MSQQRDNSGVLFRDKERKNDRAPEFTGPATIDGREYRIAAWVKDGGKGKFCSLAFTPKDDKPVMDQGQANRESEDPGAGLDSDIPF